MWSRAIPIGFPSGTAPGGHARRRSAAPQFFGCSKNCGAADRRRACPPGAVPEGNPIGIALDHMDIVRLESEPVRRDLRERDVVPLAVRMCAGEYGHLSIAVHSHDG